MVCKGSATDQPAAEKCEEVILTMIFLKTPRLCLRNTIQDDADVMRDYRNNELCSRYQRGQVRDRRGIESLVRLHRMDEIGTERPFLLAIGLKDSYEMVGEIVVLPTDQTFSFAITISYKYHRMGFAFEALSALLDLLHESYPDWEFVSFIDPKDEPSIGLLKKLGYYDYGFLRRRRTEVFGKWNPPSSIEELLQAVE